MSVATLTGPIGARLEDLRTALANSAAFRTFVGAADAAAAKAKIYLFTAAYDGTPAQFGVVGFPQAWQWQREAAYGATGMGAASVTWRLNVGLVSLLPQGQDVSPEASAAFVNAADAILLDLVGDGTLLLQSVELDEEGSGQLQLGERAGYQFAFNLGGLC